MLYNLLTWLQILGSVWKYTHSLIGHILTADFRPSTNNCMCLFTSRATSSVSVTEYNLWNCNVNDTHR